MTENNVHQAELTPEDAMLTHKDTPDQQVARAELTHQVRDRITLGAKRQKLSSRAIYQMHYQDNGKWFTQPIPIKSLSADMNQKILDRHSHENVDSLKIPRIIETYTDAEGNTHEVETQDTTSEEFIRWSERLSRWMTAINYEKLLFAIDADLESPEGQIVWPSVEDDPERIEEGLRALKALEIPESELTSIVRMINNLSIRTAQEDATDFLSESEPPSERQNTSTSSGPESRARRRGQRR